MERISSVDAVDDKIENAILIAIHSVVAPKIELANKSLNASSGQDATSVTVSSELGEHSGHTVPFENVFERKITLHVQLHVQLHYVFNYRLNTKDDTRNNLSHEVSKLSVPATHFDRQTTNASYSERTNNANKSNP